MGNTWWHRLGARKVNRKRQVRPPVARLNLEQLEDRCLLSLSGLTDTTVASKLALVEGHNTGPQVVATFTDTNPDATSNAPAVTIDWKDGTAGNPDIESAAAQLVSSDSNGSTWQVLASHPYAEPGTYIVNVSVQDADGSSLQSSATEFDVSDGALADTTPVQTVQAAEGNSTGSQVLATFTDENPSATAGDFTNVVIDWGDGTAGNPDTATGTADLVSTDGNTSTWQVAGDHTYAEPGNYTVTVSVQDADGSSVQTSNTSFSVADAALTDTTTGQTFNAVEGHGTGDVVLATFRDANPSASAADFTPTVDWGGTLVPGSTPTVSVQPVSQSATESTWQVVGNAAYAEQGTYTVQVTVADADGQTIQNSDTQVAVSDPAVQATGGFRFAAAEGADSAVQTVAAFTDPGGLEPNSADDPGSLPSDHYSASINWGDGTPSSPGTITFDAASQGYVISGFHHYAHEGTYPVVTTISHEGAPDATATSTAFVVDQAPVVTVQSGVTLQEGAWASGPLATFTDPGGLEELSHYRVNIDWGDNTADTVPTSDLSISGNTVTVNAGHQYAEEGSYAITVTVEDGRSDGVGTTTMNTARVNFAAAAGLDGRIYAIGGSDGGSRLSSVEAYDPGTETWDTGVAPLPVALDGLTAATGLDGRIFVFGGRTDAGVTNDVEAYAPDTNTWTPMAPMPTARAFAAAVTGPDGRIYVFGGDNGGALNIVESYDPVTNTWNSTPLTGMPTARRSLAATAGPDGLIYVIGGNTGSAVTGVVEAYDPAHDTWNSTPLPSLTVAREGLAAAAGGDGKIYVAGGQDGTGARPTLAETYTPGAASWQAIGDIQTGRFGLAGAAGLDGRLYLLGGADPAGNVLDGVEVYSIGGLSGSDSQSATVTDQAPVVTVSAGLGATEAQSFNGAVATFFDPAGPEDAQQYQATIDWGDPNAPPGADSVGTVSVVNGVLTVSGSHTYSEAGLFTVKVKVQDDGTTGSPGLSNCDSNTMVVADAALAPLPRKVQAVEGHDLSNALVASFSDPGSDGTVKDYEAVITWDDGHTSPGRIRSAGEHTFNVYGDNPVPYDEEGSTYPVSVQVGDVDGAQVTVNSTVFVRDARLFSAPVNALASEGSTFKGLVATFIDDNPNAEAGDFTAFIDWGDGKSKDKGSKAEVCWDEANQVFTVYGQHTYCDEGNYVVTVTVVDTDGDTGPKVAHSQTVAYSAVIVADAALKAGPAVPVNAVEGAPFIDRKVAAFTDGNASASPDDFTALIFWGDGESSLGTVVGDGPGKFKVRGTKPHAYAEEGTFSVSVMIQDVGGRSLKVVNTAAVCDAPVQIVPDSLTPPSPTEGAATGTHVLARFTDADPAGTLGDYQAVIAWGDNQSDTATAANGGIVDDGLVNGVHTFSVVGGHTYAEEGSGLNFSVQVIDNGDGVHTASDTQSASIAVADADLTDTTAAQTLPATEGNGTGTVVLATFTDANPGAAVGDFTSASIDWGDGTPGSPDTTTGTVEFVSSDTGGSQWKVTGSHTYADAGNYTVTVSVADDGGAQVSTQESAFSVADAGLTDTTTVQTLPATEGGSTGSVVLATFTDANPGAAASDFTPTVNWGGTLADGTTPTASVQFVSQTATASTWEVVGSASYAEAGSYTVTVTVDDADGSSVQTTNTGFSVADAGLTDTTATQTLSATEGNSTGSVVLATFSDANPGADVSDFTPTVDWGGTLADGATPTASVQLVSRDANGSMWQVVGSATYAETGSYTVTVTVDDADGSSVQTTNTGFSVADAALTDTTAVQTLSATEGNSTGTVVLATFSDANPGADVSDFTPTVNWGGTLVNGTTPTASVQLVSRTATASTWEVVGSASYAEVGSYTVTVTVDDADGSSVQTTNTGFSVTDAALTDTTAVQTLSATEDSSTGSVVLATFTDANPGADGSDFTPTVNWGGTLADGTTPTASVQLVSRDATSSTWEVVGSASYAEAGSYTVTVTVDDTDGSSVQTTNTGFSVADAALTDTTAAQTLSATEGNGTGSVVLATFTDANPGADGSDFTPAVDWGGTLVDGTPPTASVQLVSRDASSSTWQVVGSATYAEAGSYTVKVTVDDTDGASVQTTNTGFSVADAALTDTTAVQTLSATEGNSTGSVVLATFSDANPGADGSDFTPTVDWGGTLAEGTTPTASVQLVSRDASSSTWQVVGSATYAETGSYAVTVTVDDSDGSSVQTTNTGFSVADAALTDTTAAQTLSATEGNSTGSVVLATFSDANPGADVSDFTPTVDWGGTLVDGTTPAASVQLVSRTATASTWEVVGSASYAEVGSYTVTVTVDDADGSSAQTANTGFSVGDAALTDTTAVQTLSAMEGSSTDTVVLATFSDGNPGADVSDFTPTVDWGGTLVNGTTPTASVQLVSRTATASTWKVVASAAYAEAGSYTVTVTVDDTDGSTVQSAKTSFNVADAALTDTSSAQTVNAVEGSGTGNVVLATFSDANPGAGVSDFTPTLNWGGTLADGTTPTASVQLVSRDATSSTWQVVGGATYATAGTYKVSVQVADGDGQGVSSNKTKVSVADAVLTDTTPVRTVNVVEGKGTGNQTVATFTDANAAASAGDFTTVTITWGDGTPGQAAAAQLVSRAGGVSTWQVVGHHAYAQAGHYTIGVQVGDQGGQTVGTANTAAVVSDVGPVASGAPRVIGFRGQTLNNITVGTFTDPNPLSTAADFSLTTIDWGDGTKTVGSVSKSGGQFTVRGTHKYKNQGLYTIKVTVMDVGGATATAQTTVFIFGGVFFGGN